MQHGSNINVHLVQISSIMYDGPMLSLIRYNFLVILSMCIHWCFLSFRIPDVDDPKDRMLAVLEFYLTSFHTGRKVFFRVFGFLL